MADTPAPQATLIASTAVTADDHGKLVELAGWITLVAGILCTISRVQIRWPLRALGGTDDLLCGIATIFAIIQTAIVLQAVQLGFGKTESQMDQVQPSTIAKTIYATDLIFLASLWTGRVSVMCLLRRLAGGSNKARYCKALSAFTSTCSIVCCLVVALRQDIGKPWQYDDGAVMSNFYRWIVNGVLSITVDILAILVSCLLVWDLQMSATPKSLVITAFVLRILTLPVTILRLVSLSDVQTGDFSLSYALPEILTQVEMHSNLIATTLPCLRLFLNAWNTSFMDMRLEELDPQAYQEHMTSRNNESHALSVFKRSKVSHSASKRDSHSQWMTGNSHGRSTAIIETGHGDEDAASDRSTQAIVVKQTITIS